MVLKLADRLAYAGPAKQNYDYIKRNGELCVRVVTILIFLRQKKNTIFNFQQRKGVEN